MRTGGVVSRSRSIVDRQLATPRRVWWTSFLLVTLLSAMWGLANAPFAGPDEYVHVIRAHALDHGEFFVLYQPYIDLRTARVVGVEALEEGLQEQRRLSLRVAELTDLVTVPDRSRLASDGLETAGPAEPRRRPRPRGRLTVATQL